MKRILITLFLLISVVSFSQTELDIYFFDECKNEIKKLEFELIDSDFKLVELDYKKPIIDSLGVYFLTTKLDLKNGDFGADVSKLIDIKKFGKYTDTINISKIRFVTSNAIHSSYWNYFNCSRLTNGNEIDYYPNGNKRLSGKFKEGKPIQIKEYNQQGKLQTQIFYENFTLKYKRVNYFNNKEELIEYEIYKNKKRKTIVRTFDKKGKLISKEIDKVFRNK